MASRDYFGNAADLDLMGVDPINLDPRFLVMWAFVGAIYAPPIDLINQDVIDETLLASSETYKWVKARARGHYTPSRYLLIDPDESPDLFEEIAELILSLEDYPCLDDSRLKYCFQCGEDFDVKGGWDDFYCSPECGDPTL